MNYLEIIIKSAAIYIIMMIIIRLLGKKELGQLSTFDLVVLLILSDIGGIAIENPASFTNSLVSFAVLFGMQKLFSFILLKFAVARNIFDGHPTIIVHNGKLNIEIMKKELYTVDDLINQMRQNSIMDIKEIRLAVLEVSGDLSVFTYKQNDEIVLPVVVSGRVCKGMLSYLNLSEKKLHDMIKNSKYQIEDINYASSDGTTLFIAEEF